jgi:uncharacterized protein YrrD
MEIPLHADVICADGACGECTHVIVDPRTNTVTHLVVEDRGLPAVGRLIPVDAVIETHPDRILLRTTQADLAAAKSFVRDEFIPGAGPFQTYPAEGYMTWPATAPEVPLAVEIPQNPPGTLAVERGARVEASDGEVGKVIDLLIDPASDRITHLVMRSGNLFDKKDITIPISEIGQITEQVVYLKLSKQQIAQLPSRPPV